MNKLLQVLGVFRTSSTFVILRGNDGIMGGHDETKRENYFSCRYE